MRGTGLPQHRQGSVTGWGVRLFFPTELSCSLSIPVARGTERKEMCTHTAVPRTDPQQKKRAFFFFFLSTSSQPLVYSLPGNEERNPAAASPGIEQAKVFPRPTASPLNFGEVDAERSLAWKTQWVETCNKQWNCHCHTGRNQLPSSRAGAHSHAGERTTAHWR